MEHAVIDVVDLSSAGWRLVSQADNRMSRAIQGAFFIIMIPSKTFDYEPERQAAPLFTIALTSKKLISQGV